MHWKDQLRRVKHEWDNLKSQSRPAQAPAGDGAYWQPRFQPDAPVSDEWDAKLGNGPDGWGNQELQHYTAAADNSFQLVSPRYGRGGAR